MSVHLLEQLIKTDPGLIDEEHGVERYKYVNGNLVSYIQRQAYYLMAYSIVKAKFNEPVRSLCIGGRPTEFPGDEPYSVDIFMRSPQRGTILNYKGVGIPTEDNRFHIVNSCHSLEHLIDVHGSVSEAHRVLKVGGYFVLIVPNRLTHRHDMSNHLPGERCYNEWTPNECLEQVFSKYIKDGRFKLIQFNTRDNLLDFDILLEKMR